MRFYDRTMFVLCFVTMGAGLILTSPLSGQTGPDYQLKWVSGGEPGGVSRDGPYQLVGTIAQPDATTVVGLPYRLQGGFLPGWRHCQIDLDDLLGLCDVWLETGETLPMDLDGNQIVNLGDFAFIATHWHGNCPTDWP